jgi:hypothetical protein
MVWILDPWHQLPLPLLKVYYVMWTQYANELVNWARMLRQVDPDLRIGANGPSNKNGVSEVDAFNQKWWPYVLQTAGSSIDFVICHSYPVTGWNYDFYQQNNLNFQVTNHCWTLMHRIPSLPNVDWGLGLACSRWFAHESQSRSTPFFTNCHPSPNKKKCPCLPRNNHAFFSVLEPSFCHPPLIFFPQRKKYMCNQSV